MYDHLLGNPGSIFNGYTSLTRNMFVVTSIGMLSFGFSQHVKKTHKIYFKIFALMIFTFSIIYGFKASYDFHSYLHNIKKNKKKSIVFKTHIKQWFFWIILSYCYIALLLIFSILLILT